MFQHHILSIMLLQTCRIKSRLSKIHYRHILSYEHRTLEKILIPDFSRTPKDYKEETPKSSKASISSTCMKLQCL